MYGGRARGRGGWGGGGYAKQEAFELWPKVELPDVNGVKVEKNLVILNQRLCNFWKTSPYHLEETVKQESKNSIDIERYCDWGKPKATSKRDSIFEFLQLTPKNFPKELVGDSRSKHRKRKRARWNQGFDHLEKLEIEFEGAGDGEGAEGKGEKKEGDEDEEDDDEEKKSEEEESSDEGDYDKNIDFDDDEDDFNMEDDGNDDDNAIY